MHHSPLSNPPATSSRPSFCCLWVLRLGVIMTGIVSCLARGSLPAFALQCGLVILASSVQLGTLVACVTECLLPQVELLAALRDAAGAWRGRDACICMHVLSLVEVEVGLSVPCALQPALRAFRATACKCIALYRGVAWSNCPTVLQVS
jgi:hypothetical protein